MAQPRSGALDLAVAPDESGAAVNYGSLYALWHELDTQLKAGGMARDAFRRWDEQVRSLLRGPEVDVLMRAHPDHEPISRQTEQIARHFHLRRLLLVRKGADTLM